MTNDMKVTNVVNGVEVDVIQINEGGTPDYLSHFIIDSKTKLNLYKKLEKIRKTYTSGADFSSKIKNKMNDLGVILTQNFGESSDIKRLEDGNFSYISEMTYTWINLDDPEDRITVPFHLTGIGDHPSTAFASSVGNSDRYFFLKFFVDREFFNLEGAENDR